VGKGYARAPLPSVERIVLIAPEALVPELVEHVKDLDRELFAIEIDWDSLGWRGGCASAEQTMRARHPELTDETASSLRWYLSYMTR
jgi:hypothetical protein